MLLITTHNNATTWQHYNSWWLSGIPLVELKRFKHIIPCCLTDVDPIFEIYKKNKRHDVSAHAFQTRSSVELYRCPETIILEMNLVLFFEYLEWFNVYESKKSRVSKGRRQSLNSEYRENRQIFATEICQNLIWRMPREAEQAISILEIPF